MIRARVLVLALALIVALTGCTGKAAAESESQIGQAYPELRDLMLAELERAYPDVGVEVVEERTPHENECTESMIPGQSWWTASFEVLLDPWTPTLEVGEAMVERLEEDGWSSSISDQREGWTRFSIRRDLAIGSIGAADEAAAPVSISLRVSLSTACA